jgi:SlyX protein
MSSDRLEALEVQVSHLTRTVDELSDVVSRQADEIALLGRRMRALMEREAERASNPDAPAADQKPPHY